MADDDKFEPRLGRMRAKGKGAKARKFMSRVIAAANLARGGAASKSGRSKFTGGRIGRGAGAGRMLASRDRYAAFRKRRVIVKARTVSLRAKGLSGAKAHLRYVERDGTTKEGERGHLYAAESDKVDRAGWLEKASGDRHQFRFIVSAEDGAEYEGLQPLTRRLMARMAEDLGTHLDWVAVDHFNTGHPHTHIVVRGKDDRGKDLIIARDYIAHGLRERAAELVDLDLGPRTDDDISRRLRSEIEQERLTSIDRALLREAEADVLVSAASRGAFDHAIRTGRLRTLERLGLASQRGALHWQLSPDLEAVLRKMSERGDIIRTMQRAYADRTDAPPPSDRIIFDPRALAAGPIVGRVVERGLSDEHADRHYMIVEAVDGRSHYVDVGVGWETPPHPAGAIVRVVPVAAEIRSADRTIVAVAAASGGHYSIDAHLRHDRGASEAFAETHVRRLEAMRRVAGNIERAPDGIWEIAVDHLDRAAAYEAIRARERPVKVEILSPVPLNGLTRADACTWLDHELVAADPIPLRDAGFGREVRSAQAMRRRWLIAAGLATEEGGRVFYRPDMLAALQRREVLRVAAQLAAETSKTFSEAKIGERIEGQVARKLELVSGRYAVIERARDFTLVPWRPVLDRHVGKPVAGIMREGGVNWALGRQRPGPTIS